jgi:hypothetical protein
MIKLSQNELLDEGFGDIVRGIGKASIAAAKGIAPGLVDKAVAVAKPFIDTAKAFSSMQPKAVLKEKLKTEYFNTFDYKSATNFKEAKLPNDTKGSSRVSITFTAKRIKGVSQLQPAGTGLQGGQGDEETYTAILTRSQKGVGGEYQVEIRDSQNKIIRGTKDKTQKQRPSWSDAFEDEDFTQPITGRDLANWISDTVYLKSARLNSLYSTSSITPLSSPSSVEDFIVQLTGKTLADDADIDKIKAAFVRAKIFNEQIKMTGKSQLNFLIDSYNMIYELPKHKNY